MEKRTKKEILEWKKQVKKMTGRKIKDIESIEMIDKDGKVISYGYYQTDYDRVCNNLTIEQIQ